MSTTPTPAPLPRKRSAWRHAARIAVGVLAILLAALVGVSWYASTDRFERRVRQRLVTVLEEATGGRVELDHFRWRLTHLEFEADNLTIHGLEAAGEVPYLHVDRLFVRAKIITFFRPKIGLNALVVEHPVFHMIVYPDGSTNQPQPKSKSSSDRPVIDTIFDLAVDRTELTRGLVLLNQKAIPFEISANDLSARVVYAAQKDRYIATLAASDITARRAKLPPVKSRLDLQVNLARNHADLESLRFATGPSVLSATASVDDFNQPAWNVSAEGRVDVREVEALTAIDGLAAGVADLKLKGQGSGSRFRADGTVAVAGASYQIPEVHAAGVDVAMALHMDERELAVTGIRARLKEGGSVDAELRLVNWLASPPSTDEQGKPRGRKKEVESAVQQGIIRAQIHNVTLNTVMAAVTNPRYHDLGFDTAATGSAAVDWTGNADRLTAEARVNLAPTGRGTAGSVPLSGAVDAKYFNERGTVVIASLDAKTPATEMHVHGGLGVYPENRASSIDADLVTTNLAEFDRTLIVLGLQSGDNKGIAAIPVHLEGEAEFHGKVTGTLTDPDVNGHLLVSNFDTVFPKAAQPPAVLHAASEQLRTSGSPATAPAGVPVQSIHWDKAEANAEYSSRQIVITNARIERGKTTIDASGQLNAHAVSRRRYAYDDQSTMQANLFVKDAPVADILSMAGQALPVTGVLQARARVQGSLGNFDGDGHISIEGGQAYGMPYRSVNADIRLAGHEVGLKNLVVLQNGGTVTGEGGYDLRARSYHFTAQGRGFNLAHYPQIQSAQIPLSGGVTFEAQGNGTLRDPHVQAKMHLRDLLMGNEARGGLEADLHTANNSLYLVVNSNLESAQVRVNGQIQLSGDYQTQADLTLANLDMQPFLQLFKVQGVTGHSSLAGKMSVSGPARYPKRLSGDLQLSQFTIALSSVPLQSDGPLHANLRDGVLHLDPLHITGDDTNLRAQGTVGIFDQENLLDLHARGSVNLKLAQTFNPQISSSGHVDFMVDAGGTIKRPELGGQVKFTDVAIAMQDLPNGLSKMNGTLAFNQDRLEVQTLTAQTGGGQLSIGGFLSYQQGLYGDLSATGKDIRVRYPQGISSMADAKFRLQGSKNNLVLSGNVLLTRFAINPDLDLASYAGSTTTVSAPPDPNSPASHIRLDIHITSAPQLDFQNSFAKLAGDVDLRIRGTAAVPSVLGHITVTEGNATFAGTKYELQHGDIYFTNPVRIEPVIDLDATAHVEDYDITIGLHGTASKLNPTFRSEPPLPESDIFSLLAMGRTQEEQQIYSNQQQQAGVNSTANALLGGALNATVSSRIQKLFGGGSVKIDPTYANSVGNSTARITVEQQISKNLTLTYATNVNSTAQQLIQGELDITKNVSVLAVRDEAGVFSMVVKVHQRLR